MNIDPYGKEFTEITQIDLNEILVQTQQNDKIKKEITAIGPEDHLKALQQDLLKAGYRKLK